MEQLQDNALTPEGPREQTALRHPWRRFFARNLDLSIYELLWTSAQYFLLRWQPEDNAFVMLLTNYITLALMLFIEPLLLSTWGTTPGKAIFGLTLRTPQGERPTYGAALRRTFGMLARGYGYGIPIYNIVRMYKCKKAAQSGETMEWDEGLDYQLADARPLRTIGYVAATCALLFASFFITFQAQMPLNRAPLTPAQYVENINDVLTRPNMYFGERMEEGGRWRVDESSDMLWLMQPYQSAAHELTVENGEVKGARFSIQSDEEWIMYPGRMQKLYMTLAFFGAQRGVDCFTLNLNRDIKAMLSDTGSFDVTLCGVRIVQAVSQSGYTGNDDYYVAQEGQPHSFSMTFSMEAQG